MIGQIRCHERYRRPAALRVSIGAGLLLCLFSLPLAAGERDGRWAILLAGASGDPALQREYLRELSDMRATLEAQLRLPSDRIFLLFDDPAKDPAIIQRQSTREDLAKTCREIAGRAAKEDLVFVFLLGHGSFDGVHYKLNLVGPDPTAEELGAMLYSIPARHFVVVNTTSCSGASVAALAGPGRVVIAATKSANEKNLTHIGGFFVEGLKENNADVDKNGRVDILEAYNYAARKVEQYYSNEGILQTEHPLLDDDGDGRGNSKPGPENGEGLLARTTFLDAGPTSLAAVPVTPERQQLLLEVQSLEKQIEALKYAKREMKEEEYEKKLEELLLKLARANAKLRKN